MKNFFSILFLFITINTFAQPVTLPDSPTGNAFKEFIPAYNTGDENRLRAFSEKYYDKNIEDKIDYWLEKLYWYGPVEIHSISIDKPYDMELWLKGTITKEFFAIEILLNEETGKIKATGFLSGEKPDGAPLISVPFNDLPAVLNSYLDTLSSHGFFSGAVLVAKDGISVFEGAYGYSDLDKGLMNSLKTPFNLASVTKIFTGIAIAQLVDRGKLSYSDPISKYIPEYPSDIANKVTIHHLLTHTSGIELDHTQEFNKAKISAVDSEDLLTIHLKYLNTLQNRDSFDVLSELDYSNEGFDLAALIVERTSGMPFLSYLEKNIFSPTGMLQSGARSHSSAVGYTNYISLDMNFKRGPRVPNSIFLHNLFGSAGLYSTVGDLNKLFTSLNNNTLLSDTMKQILFSPQIKVSGNETDGRSYSYGLDIVKDNGILSLGHNGGERGVSTELRYFPEYGYTVIVLSNFRHSAITVSNYIQDLLF